VGINLTAADTVIIFDSDWNPQNDLQAQARVHRIGQTREVKIYRLITGRTYERTMFEKASRKQGLEQAVMSGHANKGGDDDPNGEGGKKKSKKDAAAEDLRLEKLLRCGAYDVFGEEAEKEAAQFNEEDIDAILSRRATKINAPGAAAGAGGALSTFSTASFVPDSAGGPDIDYDDPLFWEKLMPAAKKTSAAASKAAAEKDALASASGRNRRGVSRLGQEEEAAAAAESGGQRRRAKPAGSDDEASGNSSGGESSSRSWTKSDMKSVKRALMSIGFGRWEDVRRTSKVKAPTSGDIKAFCLELLRQCGRVAEADRESLAQIVGPSDDGSGAGEHVEPVEPPALRPVEASEMEKTCNVTEKSAKDLVRRLRQLAALASAFRRGKIAKFTSTMPAPPSAARPLGTWGPIQDLELLSAAHQKGVEDAPSAVLTRSPGAGATSIASLAATHLASSSSAAVGKEDSNPETELKRRLSSRLTDLLKALPGKSGGTASGSKKANTAVKRKGGALARAGSEEDDFADGKGKRARSDEGGSAKSTFDKIRIDNDLTLMFPGTHLPKAPAFRPRDSANRPGLLYPPGYLAVTRWDGLLWRCEILPHSCTRAEAGGGATDKGGATDAASRPLFRVTPNDGSKPSVKSLVSPSDVWRQVARDRKHAEAESVDGAALFGLDRHAVRKILSELSSRPQRPAGQGGGQGSPTAASAGREPPPRQLSFVSSSTGSPAAAAPPKKKFPASAAPSGKEPGGGGGRGLALTTSKIPKKLGPKP